MSVFVFSAKSGIGHQHYEMSVRHGYPLAQLTPFLDERTGEILATAYRDDRAYLWGAKTSQIMRTYWRRMAPGDLLLAYRDHSFFAAAFLITTAQSETIAQRVWDDSAYSLLYFFTRPLEFEPRSLAHLNRRFNYFGEMYQGFKRAPRADRIVQDFGSERQFVEQELTGEPLPEQAIWPQGPANVPAHEDFAEARRLAKERHFFARNPRLADEAKRRDNYTCTICRFDFSANYGPIGRGFIECHHNNPLSERSEREWDAPLRTQLEDVTSLCSNCHRMVHGTRPARSVAQVLSAWQTHHQ